MIPARADDDRNGRPGPEVLAIAAAHGCPASRIRALPPGVANHAYRLGGTLVLRIPRGPEFEADLAKEIVVIPAARAAGVRTAEVVAAGREPVPHVLLTRLPGRDLVDRPADVYRDVGRDLAALHRLTAADLDPAAMHRVTGADFDRAALDRVTAADLDRAALDRVTGADLAAPHRVTGADLGPGRVPVDGSAADPVALVGGLRDDGWIDAGAAEWLGRWFDRLPSPSGERVLIHGDVAPQNILADGGELTGLIDWGDAMLADPATDFAKISLRHLPDALAGYREGGAPAADWESRVLAHHLAWALARLRDPVPRLGERHWSAPPAARLLNIMRHAAVPPG